MKIVVKVGTSTLAHATGRLNLKRTGELCRVLSDLKNAGHEVILVSSGAIGMGASKLALLQKPTDVPTKQAAAAVGQCELMYAYDKLFAEYGHTVAQILLTGSDFTASDRHDNFSNTIKRLLQLQVLPIINENDTVATEEIKVGDNDTLSALVAVSVGRVDKPAAQLQSLADAVLRFLGLEQECADSDNRAFAAVVQLDCFHRSLP